MDIGEADVENAVELKILGVVSLPIYHRVALGPMNDMRGLHVNVPEDEDMTQQWVFMGSRTFIYESRNEHSVDIYDWTVRDAHTENIGDLVYRSRVESYCKNSAILVCVVDLSCRQNFDSCVGGVGHSEAITLRSTGYSHGPLLTVTAPRPYPHRTFVSLAASPRSLVS